MIRVRKPARAPLHLRTQGARALRALAADHARDPRGYAKGTQRFTFDSTLYGHASVKQALLTAQHGKCAFCESKVTHISYGDVEHFRPKGGWRQKEGGALQHPGYYWLAYVWENLFLACTLCNQQFKRNLFPLQTPARRARHHGEDVSTEEPLLIDPGAEDPEAFISFRDEVPFALGGNARGRATIRHLGLAREALAERRRDRLGLVRTLHKLVDLGGPDATEARGHLQRLRQDSEEYASMTRAFARHHAAPGTKPPVPGRARATARPGRARARTPSPSSPRRRSPRP